MTKAAEHVLELATQLDPSERAELIDRLHELDDTAGGEKEPGYDEAWAAELRERKAQVERGEETPVPWREAMARIRRGEVNGDAH